MIKKTLLQVLKIQIQQRKKQLKQIHQKAQLHQVQKMIKRHLLIVQVLQSQVPIALQVKQQKRKKNLKKRNRKKKNQKRKKQNLHLP